MHEPLEIMNPCTAKLKFERDIELDLELQLNIGFENREKLNYTYFQIFDPSSIQYRIDSPSAFPSLPLLIPVRFPFAPFTCP